ncbi:MAG TPA: hypothetical protein VFI47_17220 [Acidimicrobiales bacterium]|nr:hypothetical protein [Acidimicrobiales bacterium]
MTPEQLELDADAAERRRIWRDAMAMVLYLSIVLLAELAALPTGHDDADEPVQGPVGRELAAILWGTAIGLALAHWFAFRLATQGLRRGPLGKWDRLQALSELAGAAFVAAMASVSVLLFPDDIEQQAVPFVLAMIIGGVVYLVERGSGRSRATSLVFGVMALVLGLTVATLKSVLSTH